MPETLYTKDYYRSFDQFQANKNKVWAQLLKKFYSLNYAKNNAVILDIGCGRGELVSYLAQQGWKVYGLDFSLDALECSVNNLAKLSDSARARVHLLGANVCSLPLKDKTVDFICSIDLFEHLNNEDLRLLIQEIHRVFKDGGGFICETSPNKEYADIGYKYWIKPFNIIFNPISKIIFGRELMIVNHYSDPTHINLFSAASLRNLFRDSGFTVRVYTQWLKPDNFIGYIYKIISQLWPLTLFWPLRNLFCPYLWVEGQK